MQEVRPDIQNCTAAKGGLGASLEGRECGKLDVEYKLWNVFASIVTLD